MLRFVSASVPGLSMPVVVAVSLLVAAWLGNVKISPGFPFVFAIVRAGAVGVSAGVVAGTPIRNCGCEQNEN